MKGFCELASSQLANGGGDANQDIYKLGLAKHWKMVGVALGDLNENKMKIWGAHPLGKGVLMNTLHYFEGKRDI